MVTGEQCYENIAIIDYKQAPVTKCSSPWHTIAGEVLLMVWPVLSRALVCQPSMALALWML